MATEPEPESAAEGLRQATALLEAVAADASLLEALAPEERARFQRALASAFHPDRKVRRKRLKAKQRAQVREAKAQDDALLDATGIRTLRRKPVFSTPNYFPPALPVDAIDDEHEADRGPVDALLPNTP